MADAVVLTASVFSHNQDPEATFRPARPSGHDYSCFNFRLENDLERGSEGFHPNGRQFLVELSP
jgi:hypothetical protein